MCEQCAIYKRLLDELTCIPEGVPVDIHMSPAERRILGTLLGHGGAWVSRSQLIAVCRVDRISAAPAQDGKSLDVLVSRLRHRLEGSPITIGTLRGYGYRATIEETAT